MKQRIVGLMYRIKEVMGKKITKNAPVIPKLRAYRHQIWQITTDFVAKVSNLRVVDRRKTTKWLILSAPEALSIHQSPISIRRDVKDDMVEYNLYTRAAMTVNNPKDISRIIGPM